MTTATAAIGVYPVKKKKNKGFERFGSNFQMSGSQTQSSLEMPVTSFPSYKLTEEELKHEIHPLLVNSDPLESNNNLCIYFKLIVQNLYSKTDNDEPSSNYLLISLYALKLLTLNLFVKNHKMCLGKILSLLELFINIHSSGYEEQNISQDLKVENDSLKEFLCITLLLLIKLKNSPDDLLIKSHKVDIELIHAIDSEYLFQIFENLNFITIMSNFISSHINSSEPTRASFVLLKFSCDIVFEYLYHVELLSDREFDGLTKESTLIPTLIKDLLNNENFNNYDIDGDDFEDVDKLIAYEEFKLLLLINEQYLMKSYTSTEVTNKVFEGLINGIDDTNSRGTISGISGFINLLVYHINREESHIIKILILKFLYLVFTSSYTTKLPYVNDLKILVDIFIRELNDLDYTNEENIENRILIITYLKVMYPLLMFSQLNELQNGYKVGQILDLLRNLILNADNGFQGNQTEVEREENVIVKLALKCLTVSWLKKKQHKSNQTKTNNESNDTNSVVSASSSSSSLNLKANISNIENFKQKDSSSDSIASSFTRVASVRASSRSDYHKHTTSHNLGSISTDNSNGSSIMENNNNIFLQNSLNKISISTALTSPSGSDNNYQPPVSQKAKQQQQLSPPNLLDLPKEYLRNKPLPPTNQFFMNSSRNSSSSSISSNSLVQKAMKKKAPAPPPNKANMNNLQKPLAHSKEVTPPPPPPPRRRR